MQESRATAPRRRLPRWLIVAAGYSLSIACLLYVYRGFDWSREWPRLAATDWRWVTLAIITDILVYVCQGFRWARLLSPLGPVSSWKTTQAVYIGLFANEVLPLRSGEAIRIYLQKRWTGLPLLAVVASAVIERIIDGLWLVLAFWVASAFVPLPGELILGCKFLVALLIVLGGLLIWTAYRRGGTPALLPGWARPLVEGTRHMGSSSTMVPVILLSLVYLLLQVLPLYFLMRGYGLDLSIGAAAVVLVVLRLGTVVPQGPGNVGSFQLLTVLALKLFGVDRSAAIGFATLAFVVVTVPLWLGGFVALMMTRMRLGEIHRDAKQTLSTT
jgi:uncharacterized membrane protein YbhN (UPF0104 family)